MSNLVSVVKGIRLDRRDVEFLSAIGRYGLLGTEEAQSFYADMKLNSVLKRLRLLAAAGLTKPTRLSVWSVDEGAVPKGGRIPTLHSLTEEGAELVESQLGERPQRVLRSQPSAATFLHRREIVRVMRAFDLGCDAAKLVRPEWVMEQDIWTNTPEHFPPNQRRLLYHDFGNGVTCSPDLAGRLRIGSTELVLYWEIDLSTEGRKQLRKASKTDSYLALIHEQAWRRYWTDADAARAFVLWVYPSQRRLATLRDVLRDHPLSAACRFAAATSFTTPASLLTAAVWETIGGDRRALYSPTP